MKLSDKHKKLFRAILQSLVLVIFAYFLAILSLFPTISAHRWVTQMEMETWAGMAGHYQAKVFFEEGRYRLLELHPITKIDADNFASKFTGKHEGIFEIWTRPIVNDTNSNHRLLIWLNENDSDQKFVESFNQAMKLLWDEKQKNILPDSQSKTNNN
jgi:hypothetical protein